MKKNVKKKKKWVRMGMYVERIVLEEGFEPSTIALLVTFAQRQNLCRYTHEALTTELHERILNPAEGVYGS